MYVSIKRNDKKHRINISPMYNGDGKTHLFLRHERQTLNIYQYIIDYDIC